MTRPEKEKGDKSNLPRSGPEGASHKLDLSPFSRWTFRDASGRVIRRLCVARWFRLLGRSAVVVFPAAAAAAVALWLSGHDLFHVAWAAALVVAWLALTGLWTWWRRPSAQAALALWDEVAGRREMFLSALCFESRAPDDAGEQLHLARARARLPEDLRGLRRDLPVRLAHRAWLLPAALIVLTSLLLVPGSPAGEPPLDDAARQGAEQVAQTLKDPAALLPIQEDLKPDEKEKLKKLEAALDETAENLRKLDQDATPRDVLAELEQRAHEAETLARSLDDAAESLSSAMLAELERHADTTDLASALRAKDLDKSSDESEKLAKRLAHKDLSLDEQKRVERALEKSLGVASKRDKQGLVGKHLNKAHKELKKNRPKPAANQFRQLAKRLAQARQRQLASKRLKQLAKQLRASGQKIFGRNPSSLRRLAQNNPSGLRQLNAQQLQAAGKLSLQQLGAMGRLAPGQVQPGTPVALIPGTNLPGNPTGKLIVGPIPGTGQPRGVCPIPGTGQMAGQIPGMGQMPGGGACPIPGSCPSGGSMQGGGVGGLQAGHGTAPYGNTPTKPLAATDTGVVAPPPTGEGPSLVRNVEGGPHREEAAREFRKVAAAVLQAEEEALAEEPLPLSRRGQVLRYFTAIRRQLVDQPPAEGP